MKLSDFCDSLLSYIAHKPTDDQLRVATTLSQYIYGGEDKSVFILKGYAGTGKTTILASLIKAMNDANMKVVLMAPTGRAAKILSGYAGMSATTIHKRIYRQKEVGNNYSPFTKNFNSYKNTLFIVDEASMIADYVLDTNFGTGNVIEDLLDFVFSNNGNRLLFCGDDAQLPPVGSDYSPALDSNLLTSMEFSVTTDILKHVVRQTSLSGILFNASELRLMLFQGGCEGVFPDLKTDGFSDIKKITSETLIDDISEAYSEYGVDNTIIITRSNKSANQFNIGVRRTILDHEEVLCSNDMVMVVKNNYNAAKDISGTDFIANGDIAMVKRIRKTYDFYGFHFADVELYFQDYDTEISTKVLLDTLTSESPSLSSEEFNKLYKAVEEDYMDIENKRDRYKKMKEDPYLNALQIKFAYSVTCHKAQGGQWPVVFIDNGYLTLDMIDKDYYRWLYTAITRATDKVYLLNWKPSKTI